MSLNAAALEVLVAKGVSAADILDVARALELRRDATAAERQQRRRDRLKAEAEGAAEPRRTRTSRRDVTRDVPPNEVSNPPQPSPEALPPPRGKRAAGAFPRPEWADEQVWSDFLANRQRKRLPNTATAHRKLLADIERIADDEWPPGRLLEVATGKGWGAIYPSIKTLDVQDTRHADHRTPRQPAGHQPDGFTSALRRASAKFEADELGGLPRHFGMG